MLGASLSGDHKHDKRHMVSVIVQIFVLWFIKSHRNSNITNSPYFQTIANTQSANQ